MTEFFQALMTHSFLQYALLTALLASVVCGVIGTYVVVKRITYIAGGIAHSVLAGLGLAGYLRETLGWVWLQPLYGATLAALTAAIIIGLVSTRSKERQDTIISAIWAIGMALGVIFIYLTPGYGQNLMSYLFGNILMVSVSDLWLLALLDLIVLVVVGLFHRQFAAICFDEEFARVRGVPVELFYILLLCLAALTVVILATVVGVVMVIALLSLPVAIASRMTSTLPAMMLLGSLICLVVMSSGLMISYSASLPSGATIIILTGAVYLGAMITRWLVRARVS